MADVTVQVIAPGSLTTWGQGGWSTDAWGLTPGLGTQTNSVTVEAQLERGWGGQTWGENNWGDLSNEVAIVSGISADLRTTGGLTFGVDNSAGSSLEVHGTVAVSSVVTPTSFTSGSINITNSSVSSLPDFTCQSGVKLKNFFGGGQADVLGNCFLPWQRSHRVVILVDPPDYMLHVLSHTSTCRPHSTGLTDKP